MKMRFRFLRFYLYYFLRKNPGKMVLLLGVSSVLLFLHWMIDVREIRETESLKLDVIWIDTIQKKFLYQELGETKLFSYSDYQANLVGNQISLSKENVRIEGDVAKQLLLVLLWINLGLVVFIVLIEWGSPDLVLFEHVSVYDDSLEKCIVVIKDDGYKYIVIFDKLVMTVPITRGNVGVDEIIDLYKFDYINLPPWLGTKEEQRDNKLNQILG